MLEKYDTNYLNQILHFTVYRYCTSCMGGGREGGRGSFTVLDISLYFIQAISGRPQSSLGAPVVLPSRYQSSASTYSTASKRRTSGSVGRTKTWSKDVVCIPNGDKSPLNTTTFPIPRGEARGRLASQGLVGKS